MVMLQSEKMTEEKNKKEKGCPLCKVSEETLLSLRESGRQKYLSQKEAKEKEKSLKNKERRMKKILTFLGLYFNRSSGGG